MHRAVIILLLVLTGLISRAGLGAAQTDVNRSYYYPSIDYQITVNTDSTFDVVESQTYRFTGEYYQGWRDIPLNKINMKN